MIDCVPLLFQVISTALPSLLLGPVAGVFVDRWDRKRTMIVADLLRALLVLLVILTLVWGTNWPLFAFAVREISVWTFRAVAVVLAGVTLLTVARARGQSLATGLREIARLQLRVAESATDSQTALDLEPLDPGERRQDLFHRAGDLALDLFGGRALVGNIDRDEGNVDCGEVLERQQTRRHQANGDQGQEHHDDGDRSVEREFGG